MLVFQPNVKRTMYTKFFEKSAKMRDEIPPYPPPPILGFD